MILSLFWEGRLFEGGVYFKIRDFREAFIRGGRLFEAGRLFEEIRYANQSLCLRVIYQPDCIRIIPDQSQCTRSIHPLAPDCVRIIQYQSLCIRIIYQPYCIRIILRCERF